MGTTYNPKDPILGMEARRFRNLLLSWERNRDLRAVARVASLDTTPVEVAAVIDEAESRGLLGFPQTRVLNHQFGLVDPGLALVNATSRKRIPASKAREILQDVLNRATLVNERRDLPFMIADIWLYGSLARGSETVDDIDLVIESRTPPHMMPSKADKLAFDMCRRMGGESAITMGGVSGFIQASEWVRDRFMFGPRRNQRLSVRTDPSELVAMAVPCRNVFTSAQGSDIDAPLLGQHPASTVRQPHIGPPRIVPDLSLVPALAPAHCHAAKNLAITEVGYRPDKHARIGVVCAGESWIPQHLRSFVASCGPLDGRLRAVVHDWEDLGQAVLVEARLEDDVLSVEAGRRSDGSPIDEASLDAYLRAVIACTSHRAGLRGECLAAGFIDGAEVDIIDGVRRSGVGLGH